MSDASRLEGKAAAANRDRARLSGTASALAVLASLVGSIALAESAVAQTESASAAADPWSGVEEMLVTGSTREGMLADPTTSAIAFDESELIDIGAQDVSDLARFTPSLEINTTSATTPTFFIRGVGLNDANSNAAGAIAIYVDDVPINAPAIQLAGLFDTANVEVLRGPQAFIDARNASGGMINTVSKKPDGELSAFLRSDFGNYGFRDFEGAIGFPIFSDIVSGRFAFRHTYRDGLIENRCGNLPASTPDLGTPPRTCNEVRLTGGVIPTELPSETNDLDRWGTRTQFRIAPPDAPGEMEWLANFHTARIDQRSPLGQTIGTTTGRPVTGSRYIDPKVDEVFGTELSKARQKLPGASPQEQNALARFQTIDRITRNIDLADPYENDYDLVGEERLSQLGGFLKGTMRFGEIDIKSVTAIERYDRERDGDFDFSSNPSIHTFRDDDATQYSQNLGLETELDDVPVVLKGGGYLLIENLDTQSDFLLQTNQNNSRRLAQSYTQDLYSFGLFASFSWQMLEDLTLEAGARLNWERKDFELGVVRTLRNGDVLGSDPAELTRTWSAPTYGINLTYDMTEDLHAFWKYTRGWKGGHINASVLEIRGTGQQGDRVTPTPTVAQPETIDAVEFGIGGVFYDGRIDLNVAGFYYKYSDYQVFVLESQAGSPPQLEIINANDARIYGVEADLTLRPLQDVEAIPPAVAGLTLSMNFAWLESEFLDFSDIRSVFLPADLFEVNIGAFTVDYTGNRLPNTPQFKLSATAEYPFELGSIGVLTLRYDVSWTDDIFFDPSEGRGAPDFATREFLPDYAVGQTAYAIHDFRLTFSDPEGRISIAGWVRNMTNKIYKRNVLDVSTAFNQINSFVGDPRTYGGSVSFKF